MNITQEIIDALGPGAWSISGEGMDVDSIVEISNDGKTATYRIDSAMGALKPEAIEEEHLQKDREGYIVLLFARGGRTTRAALLSDERKKVEGDIVEYKNPLY